MNRDETIPQPDPAALAAFGHSVRERRKANLGISQEAFAHRCGISRTYVGKIEAGQRNPTLGTILCLAKVLNTPVSELLKPVDPFVSLPDTE